MYLHFKGLSLFFPFSLYQEYEEAGTVKQNYVNILLMLLRLRQACDHPLLVNGEYSFTWESSVGLAKKQNYSEASLAICGICNVRFFCLVNSIFHVLLFFYFQGQRGVLKIIKKTQDLELKASVDVENHIWKGFYADP